jgi:hypothetical protein
LHRPNRADAPRLDDKFDIELFRRVIERRHRPTQQRHHLVFVMQRDEHRIDRQFGIAELRRHMRVGVLPPRQQNGARPEQHRDDQQRRRQRYQQRFQPEGRNGNHRDEHAQRGNECHPRGERQVKMGARMGPETRQPVARFDQQLFLAALGQLASYDRGRNEAKLAEHFRARLQMILEAQQVEEAWRKKQHITVEKPAPQRTGLGQCVDMLDVRAADDRRYEGRIGKTRPFGRALEHRYSPSPQRWARKSKGSTSSSSAAASASLASSSDWQCSSKIARIRSIVLDTETKSSRDKLLRNKIAKFDLKYYRQHWRNIV